MFLQFSNKLLNSFINGDLAQSPQPLGIQRLAQGHVWMEAAARLRLSDSRVCLPAGTLPLHCVSPFSKTWKVSSKSWFLFTLRPLLTFRWQLLSRHMCTVLLSRSSAATAALTLHRHRGDTEDLCGSLWLAKRYRVGGRKQKQFFRHRGEYIEVKWT